ncbi:MAG: GNAT family N-acetyltransferase [Proteobacteria bacterium]|nr:GNAT family N-acetyltransferase [Pseudomonadota bacterium]
MYRIRLASLDDLDALCHARYRVYVEMDGFLPPNEERRVVDRYDRLSETTHIVAEAEGRIVGAVRLTRWSQLGLPAFDYFDFAPHLPAVDERVANGSLIFVETTYRRTRMGHNLMMHWYAELLTMRCTHAIGVLNPPLVPWLSSHGFQAVGDAARDPHTGVPFVPVLLNLARLNPEVAAAATGLGSLCPAGKYYDEPPPPPAAQTEGEGRGNA